MSDVRRTLVPSSKHTGENQVVGQLVRSVSGLYRGVLFTSGGRAGGGGDCCKSSG